MISIPTIGTIKSKYTEKADPFEMKREESILILDEQFVEGLLGIEERMYLQVLFHFHKSNSYSLINEWYYRGERGVFACRTPNRPSTIGTTTVKLLKIEGNRLTVTGLDALDGTPLIDIKPWIAAQDQIVDADYQDEFFKDNPRASILQALKSNDKKRLLLDSGALHGHFCPGLAYGVIASVFGLERLAQRSGQTLDVFHRDGGLEELLAIIEINSCFADGIQYVSGATLGNNGLILKEYGKSAVTFTKRDGKGVRLLLKPEVKGILAEVAPEFNPLFEKVIVGQNRDEGLKAQYRAVAREAGFALLEIEPSSIFTCEEVDIAIPAYAPIRPSQICRICGESVMGGKMSKKDPTACRGCMNDDYDILDGSGIHKEIIG